MKNPSDITTLHLVLDQTELDLFETMILQLRNSGEWSPIDDGERAMIDAIAEQLG